MATAQADTAVAISALAPAGVEAERVAQMIVWLSAAGLVVWVMVVGLALYAAYGREVPVLRRAPLWVVVVGGVLVPTVAVTALLIYGLTMMTTLRPSGPQATVHVTAERWWWRVTYDLPDGGSVELANELRLPVNRRTRIGLQATEVIHAFWVPALAGKVDMIPGRQTELVLEPTRIGRYGGICAEYCGTAHAQMAFVVEVMTADDYAQWLQRQARTASKPTSPQAQAGHTVFERQGCGGCHRVRGTSADGAIGPDLTHLASRLSLGAGILPLDASSLRGWIRHTDTLKPGVLMPPYAALADDELQSLAAYLMSLQ